MISRLRFMLKSLRYHWRLHTLLFTLAALTSTLIIGAFILGDSVTHSLHQISKNRLGRIQWVVRSESHPFRSILADQTAKELKTDCAPLLALDAIAAKPGGAARIPSCRLLGIDQRFFNLSSGESIVPPNSDEVLLNQKAARHLELEPGDTLLINITQPETLPVDAPFAQKNQSITLRLKVRTVLDPKQFGDFSLLITPEVPFNAFVNLDALAEKTGKPKQCNLLLIAKSSEVTLTDASVQSAFKKHWQIEDTPLEIHNLPNHTQAELRSRDVFIKPGIIASMTKSIPDVIPLFTYFVNSLQYENRKTPYSMVSSLPPASGIQLPDDAIVINSWLAQDLGAKPGDTITLHYYTIDVLRKLITHFVTLRVHSVVPIAGWSGDKTLMPNFPGLSKAGNCSDWEPGVPIELDHIRSKDEAYWDQYRGTPKAFITLTKAQSLWSNDFGNLTALRFPIAKKNEVKTQLQDYLQPSMFGIRTINIKDAAQRSANDSIDFSELFLSLSFFIVLAALWLLSLSFGFSITRRTPEIYLMRALGFQPRSIKQYFFTEGLFIAFGGAALGIPIAIAYNRILLFGLKTVWVDAVRTTALETFIEPRTLAIGFLSALLTSLIAMFLVMRAHFRPALKTTPRSPIPSSWLWVNRLMFLGLVIGLIAMLVTHQSVSAVFFVIAGILALANGLVFFLNVFQTPTDRPAIPRLSLNTMAFRNIAFRRNNSLTVTALLAIGIFMIMAVSANRQDLERHAESRASGTGGYDLFCQTTLPLDKPLSNARFRADLALTSETFQDVHFHSMRLKSGNDASCLNINRTLTPAILGVNPQSFKTRNSFQFSRLFDKTMKASPWSLLDKTLPDGSIPAIADQTVIQWGLGKKLGDTIVMNDDHGQQIQLRLVAGLANSVFQGYVLIGEKNFLKHFPSIGGFQVILADTPPDLIQIAQKKLARGLITYGIVITPTTQRLSEFNSVQNTYLSIFLLLGGLGLMLSTLGLGIVLYRNLLERRGETALLWAMGFSQARVTRMLVIEYALLIFSGLIIGTGAAFIAVLPALLNASHQIPFAMIFSIIFGIAAIGLIVLIIGSRLALPRRPLEGLRLE